MATLPGASSNLSSFHLADEKTRGLKHLAQDQPVSTLPLGECLRGVGMWSMPWGPRHTPSTAQFWELERRGSGCCLAQQRTKPQGETEVREDGGLAQDHPCRAGWGLGGRGGCRPRGLDGGADRRGLGQGGLQSPKAEPRGGNPTGSAGTSRRGVRLDARAHLSEGAARGAGATGVTAGPSRAPIKPRQREASEHRVGDGGAGGGCAPGLPAQRQGMARLGGRSEGAGERDWSGEKAQPAPVSAPSGSTGAPLPRGPGRAAPGSGDVHWGSAARAARALSRPRHRARQLGEQRRAAAERQQVGTSRVLLQLRDWDPLSRPGAESAPGVGAASGSALLPFALLVRGRPGHRRAPHPGRPPLRAPGSQPHPSAPSDPSRAISTSPARLGAPPSGNPRAASPVPGINSSVRGERLGLAGYIWWG